MARQSVISSLPYHLPLSFRSPRNLAATAIAVGTVTIAGIVWYLLRCTGPGEEEIERSRRDLLAATGRITDGSITDTPAPQDGSAPAPLILVYNYRIAGVSYECAQDVTLLADHIRDVRADLPIQVRYDPHNPANSIVVAEAWSGLRLSTHPETPKAATEG